MLLFQDHAHTLKDFLYSKHDLKTLAIINLNRIVCFLQMLVVDRVDIGLLNVTQAHGRRRLNQTISQLADVIGQGLTGTVANFRFGVTSLRQCASGDDIKDGCSNGTVFATGPPISRNSATFTGTVGDSRCIQYWLFAMAF